MVMGPHQAFGNNPRSIEYAVEWITEAIRYFEDQGITYVEARREGVEKWNKRKHYHLQTYTLWNVADSGLTGYRSQRSRNRKHDERCRLLDDGSKQECW